MERRCDVGATAIAEGSEAELQRAVRVTPNGRQYGNANDVE